MSDVIADYMLLWEIRIEEYKQSLAQAGKDHNFKPDDYLLNPQVSQRESAARLAIQQFAQSFRNLRVQLEDFQKQNSTLLDANDGLIKQIAALKERLAAVELQLRVALKQNEAC